MAVDRNRESRRGERRKTPRSKASLPALMLMDRQEKHTKTVNVSLGGLMIQTDEPLPRDRKLRVAFIAESEPIEAEGRIIYSQKAGSGYLSGLSFDRVSRRDKEKLSRYLNLSQSGGSGEPARAGHETDEARPQEFSPATEVILPGSYASAMLIMKGDRKSERTVYEINRRVTSIGRHNDNDMVLRDPSVSGHHAKIRMEEDGFFIYDFASTNGTRVNGHKTYRKRIKDGDIIEIGQPTFTFLMKKKSRSSDFKGD